MAALKAEVKARQFNVCRVMIKTKTRRMTLLCLRHNDLREPFQLGPQIIRLYECLNIFCY